MTSSSLNYTLVLFYLISITLFSSFASSSSSIPNSIPIVVIVNILSKETILETSLESILRTCSFDHFEPHIFLLSHESSDNSSILAADAVTSTLFQLCEVRFKDMKDHGSCRIMFPNNSISNQSSNSSSSKQEFHPFFTSLKFLLNQHHELMTTVQSILYLDSYIQLTRGSILSMYLGLGGDGPLEEGGGRGGGRKGGGAIVIPRCISFSRGKSHHSSCQTFPSTWKLPDLPLGVSVDSLGEKLSQLSLKSPQLNPPCSSLGDDTRLLMISSSQMSQLLHKSLHQSTLTSTSSSSSSSSSSQEIEKSYSFEIPSDWSCHQVPSSLVVDILPEPTLISSLKIKSSSHSKSLILPSPSPLLPSSSSSPLDEQISQWLNEYHLRYPVNTGLNISILFLLSEISVSGGIVSILQEVISLRSRGLRVHVAVQSTSSLKQMNTFIQGLSPTNIQLLQGMILTFSGNCCFPHKTPKELIKIASTFDIVIGTYFTTISAVTAISKKYPKILPAYYVQDYEPWFLCNPKECLISDPSLTSHSPLNQKLLQSLNPREYKRTISYKFSLSTYSALSRRIFMFAKSNWIIEMVKTHHGNHSKIQNVIPSIDHLTYYPSPYSNTRSDQRIQVIAMIRARTPRRNALNCLDLMMRIAHQFRQQQQDGANSSRPQVRVVLFGIPKSDLIALHERLIEQKGYSVHRDKAVLFGRNVHLLEVLKSRYSLADLYRESDLFVDISWWQAFGRSGVEAMACGCVPIFPSLGAASEVCQDGKSCVYHDGDDLNGFYEQIVTLIEDPGRRKELAREGIKRAEDFSVELAGTSILSTLKRGLEDWREMRLKKEREGREREKKEIEREKERLRRKDEKDEQE